MPNPFAPSVLAIYHVQLVDTDPPDHPTAGNHRTVLEDELKWAGVTRVVNFCRMMDYGVLTPTTWQHLCKAHTDGEYQAHKLELMTKSSLAYQNEADREYTGFNLSIEGPIQPKKQARTEFEAEVPNAAAYGLIKSFEDYFDATMPHSLGRNLVSTLRLWGYITAREMDVQPNEDQTPLDAAILAQLEAMDNVAVALFG